MLYILHLVSFAYVCAINPALTCNCDSFIFIALCSIPFYKHTLQFVYPLHYGLLSFINFEKFLASGSSDISFALLSPSSASVIPITGMLDHSIFFFTDLFCLLSLIFFLFIFQFGCLY